MKLFTRFLVFALAIAPGAALATPVASTLGNNLTAYNPNGNAGAINNNAWNNLTNPRGGGGNTTNAPADFGNCNSVILRCAQPKCASGGCTTMDIATPIVSGCVMSNSACKQYAEDGLIETIAAQLVANSTAKNNAAAAAAANAAAAQSNQQLQQMQYQMQQMQREMAAQNQETVAQLQAALEEQKQQTAQAIADASAASAASAAAAQSAAVASGGSASGTDNVTTVVEGLTAAQQLAAQTGVSADILAREQIAGQILSKVENAQAAMKNVRAAMQDAFTYAGCDSKGDNCTGPKRVTVFKQKAMAFFEPYEAVLDELYDALIMAQSVGVDISDIYMMLNGSCNVWGEYLCYGGMVQTVGLDYDSNGGMTAKTVKSWALYDTYSCKNGKSQPTNFSKGGASCTIGAVIPPEDSPSCVLNKMITDNTEVQRNYLFADSGDYDEHIRVGCASSALESSAFFRGRKKQASIDIETLQRMIQQDAPSVYGRGVLGGAATTPDPDGVKYCAVTQSSLQDLQKVVSLKKLPSRVCVKDGSLKATYVSGGQITPAGYDALGSSNSGHSQPDYNGNEAACAAANADYDTSTKNCTCNSGEWVEGVCIK